MKWKVIDSHKVIYNGTGVCEENKNNLFVIRFPIYLVGNVFRDLTFF